MKKMIEVETISNITNVLSREEDKINRGRAFINLESIIFIEDAWYPIGFNDTVLEHGAKIVFYGGYSIIVKADIDEIKKLIELE